MTGYKKRGSELKINYNNYREIRKSRSIHISIDRSIALKLIGLLPPRYQIAYRYWKQVRTYSIPGALSIAVFIQIWVGIGLLIIGVPLAFKASRSSAASYVLQHAEEDKAFFDMLAKNNYLIFKGRI